MKLYDLKLAPVRVHSAHIRLKKIVVCRVDIIYFQLAFIINSNILSHTL